MRVVCVYDDAQACAHISILTPARSPHGAYMLSVLIVPAPAAMTMGHAHADHEPSVATPPSVMG